ncbi:hypothetical protein [Streptomyces sp. NPDC018045]|uniref:hypothetical protein n=1 Tax=Streptomyces sp. NPDC018045 TaxID=3365037 RepID=UPI0037A2B725
MNEAAETIDARWGTTYRVTGVLADLMDTSLTEAFARLRGLVFAAGRPLPALAHDILHNRRSTTGDG